MMMTSALCVILFFGGMAALSVLLVTKFRDSPKLASPLSNVMLDLTPPVATALAAPWAERPDSPRHGLLPALSAANTGWLGLIITLPASPVRRAENAVVVTGLARVPDEMASSADRLQVVFESRSTGEKFACVPVLLGVPPGVAGAENPTVGFERAVRAHREKATVIGFFVTSEAVKALPAAEYRVFAHVDFAHSNEQRIELA